MDNQNSYLCKSLISLAIKSERFSANLRLFKVLFGDTMPATATNNPSKNVRILSIVFNPFCLLYIYYSLTRIMGQPKLVRQLTVFWAAFVAGFELHLLGFKWSVAKKQHIVNACSAWGFGNNLILHIVIILYWELWVNSV